MNSTPKSRRRKSATSSDDYREVERKYLEICEQVGTSPDANVRIALSAGIPHLSLGPDFKLQDMFALKAILSEKTSVKSLSFRRSSVERAVCYVLRDILLENNQIRWLNLSGLNIDFHACQGIADMLAGNSSLEHLLMSGNRLGLRGAEILAAGIARNSGLKFVDVHNCALTAEGVRLVEDSCRAKGIEFDTEANFLREEVANSVTHGIGIILSFVGTAVMYEECKVYGPRHKWGVGIFMVSLIILYCASTLCHSFSTLRNAGVVFRTLDHAAIYILIAGTYTPLCFVNFASTWSGVFVVCTVWLMALLGILLCTLGDYPRLELGLYITMGWCVVASGQDVLTHLPPVAVWLLIAGGLAYTGGIYFFITGMSKPIRHSIWHVFVLAGSMFHFFAVREAVFHESIPKLVQLIDPASCPACR